ncbi:hypothetical protein MGEO_16735 [Marivita geojedonensis]|uniref:Uncharacterized protein n=1 Tax=Marivita geojedonensis TaxID=1123756 RepID=A0A1X4NHA5_9RHOB|nr:hypothetical protein MGEO_16735 [Marivita geojedonensis]PRY74318.1 hypothetical protein CLV76_12174 [Marivita geojedonensis]
MIAFLVTGLGDEAFQHLPLMINRAPKVIHLKVDIHEHFVELRSPPVGSHALDPTFPDLTCKHRTKPMPPVSDRFVADVDTAFMKQVLDIA